MKERREAARRERSFDSGYSRKPNKTPPPIEDGARSPASVDRNVSAAERFPLEQEVTRNLRGKAPSVSLSNVKRVYVESVEDGPLAHTIREMLVKNLRASNRFTLTQSRDEAEALFKVSAKPVRTSKDAGLERASIVVRLINANGETIWPLKQKGSEGKYLGSTTDVTAKIVKDLLDKIERLEKQRQ